MRNLHTGFTEQFSVTLRGFPSCGIPVFQPPELDAQHRRLDRVEPAVDPFDLVLVLLKLAIVSVGLDPLSDVGPLNNFLSQHFGFTVPWLTDPSLAMFSVSLVITWKFVGYYGLILYSGLVAIPKEIYEAARLDHSGPVKTLLRITLPLINAQILTVLVLAIAVAFAVFTEPYMLTGGGPMSSTTMPQLVMYETAFQRLQPGQAAMMASITALVSYAVIRLFRKLFERDVRIA